MNQLSIDALRYPIGKFEAPAAFDQQLLSNMIQAIEEFPALLRREVSALSETQLDTPYRPEGWTIRQVIHHCADSHMNGIIRHKLCVTEDNPTIKPYMEDRFAKLADYAETPVESSLVLLEQLHKRWGIFLRSLPASSMERTYFHPEHQRSFTLFVSIANYAWHGKHHLAHITQTKAMHGWT